MILLDEGPLCISPEFIHTGYTKPEKVLENTPVCYTMPLCAPHQFAITIQQR